MAGWDGSPKHFGIPLTRAYSPVLLHLRDRHHRQELVRQAALLLPHMRERGGLSNRERSGGLFSKSALKSLF